MSGVNEGFEVSVQVTVYRRVNGERMSLSQNWIIDEARPSYMFQTLADFSDLAEKMKERDGVREVKP